MVWPAADTVVGDADLVNFSPGAAGAFTVADEEAELTAGPDGGVPDAIAVLWIDPASMSAWVTV
jgi:hypothetical protein